MPVRMKDIARDLGLSVVTISKVLRNHDDISDKTRARVLQRVKELNYRPNLAARSLVTGRSSLIGLVVPDLLQPFFAEIAKSLSATLRKSGYSLIISSYDQDPETEVLEIQHLLSLRLDALVVASCHPTPDAVAHIQSQDTGLVLIDRNFPGFACNYVGVDDFKVGLLATKHLIASGKSRIAHIRGPQTSPGMERYAGYREALKSHRIPFRPEYVVELPSGDVEVKLRGAEIMDSLLNLSPKPDAVFCFSDTIAMGAIDAIYGRSLKIPGDVAVIGCGNLYYDSSLRVSLSSIDQHSHEVGEKTGKLIIKMLSGKGTVKPKKIILDPVVVQRESTGTVGKTRAT